MAIKTKKIDELSGLSTTVSDFKEGKLYFLGTKDGVTGKISSSDITAVISSLIPETPQTTDAPQTRSIVDVEESRALVQDSKRLVESVQASLADFSSKYTSFTGSQTRKHEEIDSTLASLQQKVEALEAFVHALQGESYLTLANIKKAAAEHCPCEATHEQSAE